MKTTISKDVAITICKVCKMNMVCGEFITEQLEDEIIIGNLTKKRATNYIRNKYNDPYLIVPSVETYIRKYTMPLDEFMEHALLISELKEEREEN